MRSRLLVLMGIAVSITAALTACTQQQSRVHNGSQSIPGSNSDGSGFGKSDDINIRIHSNRNATDFNMRGNAPQSVPLEENGQVAIEQYDSQTAPDQQLYVVEPSDRDTISGERLETSNELQEPAVKVDANSRLGSVHVSAPFVKIDKDSNSRNVRIKLPGIHINADVE